MISVSVGGTEISIKAKRLLDYVDKLDFIKMRRSRPWDLIQGFPPEMTEENYKILVGIAMRTVYANSSSVCIEEEILFDRSEEGFYYELWRCLPKRKNPGKGKQPDETWKNGLNRARLLWESDTDEEKSQIKIALFATDESNNLKNSDGPSDPESQPGLEPEKPLPSK